MRHFSKSITFESSVGNVCILWAPWEANGRAAPRGTRSSYVSGFVHFEVLSELLRGDQIPNKHLPGQHLC